MSEFINTAVVLRSHPDHAAALENFGLRTERVRPLNPGEFLVENHWLSVDLYIRPRLNKNTRYASPIGVGEVIQGETVGEVVASRNPQFRVGDRVFTFSGWQRYAICDAQNVTVHCLPPTALPALVFLGVVGTPGRAAWFGLHKIAKPQPGETLVVGAAAGAVGSAVGQLAKLAGCRAVGLAGSDEKCRYAVETLGFDRCLNYKTADLDRDLRAACPDGIDIYFENVGGRVALFVARLLNDGARVPICGNAAEYNNGRDADAAAPAALFSALPNAPLNRFFLVTEWFRDYAESDAFLLQAAETGALKYRETIADGLERAPQAFIDMLDGKHIGKQLIRLR